MKKIIYLSLIFLVTIIAGCSSAKSAMPLDMITAHKWRLESIHGQSADASQYGNGLPTASFTTDNKVMGTGGCNSYSESFNISDEGGINISKLISTKMACEKGSDKETDFLNTLNKANQAKIDEDKLTLMNGVEEILVFRPLQE